MQRNLRSSPRLGEREGFYGWLSMRVRGEEERLLYSCQGYLSIACLFEPLVEWADDKISSRVERQKMGRLVRACQSAHQGTWEASDYEDLYDYQKVFNYVHRSMPEVAHIISPLIQFLIVFKDIHREEAPFLIGLREGAGYNRECILFLKKLLSMNLRSPKKGGKLLPAFKEFFDGHPERQEAFSRKENLFPLLRDLGLTSIARMKYLLMMKKELNRNFKLVRQPGGYLGDSGMCGYNMISHHVRGNEKLQKLFQKYYEDNYDADAFEENRELFEQGFNRCSPYHIKVMLFHACKKRGHEIKERERSFQLEHDSLRVLAHEVGFYIVSVSSGSYTRTVEYTDVRGKKREKRKRERYQSSNLSESIQFDSDLGRDAEVDPELVVLAHNSRVSVSHASGHWDALKIKQDILGHIDKDKETGYRWIYHGYKKKKMTVPDYILDEGYELLYFQDEHILWEEEGDLSLKKRSTIKGKFEFFSAKGQDRKSMQKQSRARMGEQKAKETGDSPVGKTESGENQKARQAGDSPVGKTESGENQKARQAGDSPVGKTESGENQKATQAGESSVGKTESGENQKARQTGDSPVGKTESGENQKARQTGDSSVGKTESGENQKTTQTGDSSVGKTESDENQKAMQTGGNSVDKKTPTVLLNGINSGQQIKSSGRRVLTEPSSARRVRRTVAASSHTAVAGSTHRVRRTVAANHTAGVSSGATQTGEDQKLRIVLKNMSRLDFDPENQSPIRLDKGLFKSRRSKNSKKGIRSSLSAA